MYTQAFHINTIVYSVYKGSEIEIVNVVEKIDLSELTNKCYNFGSRKKKLNF